MYCTTEQHLQSLDLFNLVILISVVSDVLYVYLIIKTLKAGLVMYICNPSTREAEAEGKKTPN
jgi:hypothetical protein